MEMTTAARVLTRAVYELLPQRTPVHVLYVCTQHAQAEILAELAGPPSARHVVRLEKVEDTSNARFLSTALFR